MMTPVFGPFNEAMSVTRPKCIGTYYASHQSSKNLPGLLTSPNESSNK